MDNQKFKKFENSISFTSNRKQIRDAMIYFNGHQKMKEIIQTDIRLVHNNQSYLKETF